MRSIHRNLSRLATMTLTLATVHRAVCQTPAASVKAGATGFATCGTTAPGLGKITGRFVADSPGVGLRRGVMIRNGCSTVADLQGVFSLVGLPPGDHAVTFGDAGVVPLAPIVVHVAADSTSTVTIRLEPENRVTECLAVAECAGMIAPASPAVIAALSDTEQVQESAFRMAIMMRRRLMTMWKTTPAPGPTCLAAERYNNSATSAVIDAVKVRFPMVLPASGCDRGPTGRGSYIYVAGTQDRASVITVSHVVVDGTRATANASDRSLSWACTFERTPSGWRPVSCRTTGAS